MPTRFDAEPDRSIAQLDLSPARSGIFTPGMEAIDITERGVHRFNAVARSVNETMPPLSADQLAGVARRVLRTAATGGESPFVRSRLRRAVEIRAMSLDAAWTMTEADAKRVGDLLAYIDDPDGLIHDDVPFIGRLDDALLVDIAMDTLRTELDDYAEFRRYRDAEKVRLGETDGASIIDRANWQRARDDEVRLEQQLRRVRDKSYASGAAARVFRVC